MSFVIKLIKIERFVFSVSMSFNTLRNLIQKVNISDFAYFGCRCGSSAVPKVTAALCLSTDKVALRDRALSRAVTPSLQQLREYLLCDLNYPRFGGSFLHFTALLLPRYVLCLTILL